ncbi:MAG: hypothetical protein V1770_01215 [bacterium]
MKEILPKEKDFYIIFIIIALITGLAYFIIQINYIPKPNFIPFNLDYMPR